VGFLKPRFRKAFRVDFENHKIPIFDFEQTTLISLPEANKVKKELKSNAIKLTQINRTPVEYTQPKEVLTPE
jgi:hypothetical protein